MFFHGMPKTLCYVSNWVRYRECVTFHNSKICEMCIYHHKIAYYLKSYPIYYKSVWNQSSTLHKSPLCNRSSCMYLIHRRLYRVHITIICTQTLYLLIEFCVFCFPYVVESKLHGYNCNRAKNGWNDQVLLDGAVKHATHYRLCRWHDLKL